MPIADPDQLVVRVPVRLAHVAVADAALVELEDLEGIRLGGQIVDRGLDHHPTLKRIRTMNLDSFPREPLLFGPSPVHPLDRLTAHLGGARLWAKRDDCNSGLAYGGNKTRKLEYLVADALGEGLRHARVDRRRAVEPHAPGRGGRRAHRTGLRARPGELGRLAGRGLRPRREHPAVAHHGRGRPPGRGGLRDRLQGELGAGAGRRRSGRRQALRDPGRCLRPRAGRPRLRALGAGAGGAGARARRVLRHGRRVLGHREHAGRAWWPASRLRTPSGA